VTTVAELRQVVRTQTQTDPADLPDLTIDVFLQQGYERTLNAEVFWPFFATSWPLTQIAGDNFIELPGNVNEPGITALWDDDHRRRMLMIPQIYAEDHFGGGNTTGSTHPLAFSVWGTRAYLWPGIGYDHDVRYTLRGYRKPVTWLDPNGSPDCDPRLHLPISHFACALAYAQQEDVQLEATYMVRWQADVELAHANIMEPVHHRPLVMGGSIPRYSPEFVPTGYVVVTPP